MTRVKCIQGFIICSLTNTLLEAEKSENGKLLLAHHRFPKAVRFGFSLLNVKCEVYNYSLSVISNTSCRFNMPALHSI